MCSNHKNKLYIDLNISDHCNFGCKYCGFAKAEVPKHKMDVQAFFDFYERLVNHPRFHHYERCQIALFGGEPSLEYKLVNEILKKYVKDDRVSFLLYSNGSDAFFKIQHDLRKFTKRSLPDDKFIIQVSYDGAPVHDQNRVLKNGKPTSKLVKATIMEWRKRYKDLNFLKLVIKSTLGYSSLPHMFAAYEDVYKLAKKASASNIVITYNPSLDTFDSEEDMLAKYGAEYEQNLLQIMNHILATGDNIFNWFGDKRKICAMGKDMMTLDTRGNVYPCHSYYCLKNPDSIRIGNIGDANILTKIVRAQTYYRDTINGDNEPDVCQSCHSNSCKRCNIALLDLSKKKTRAEKLVDHPSSKNNCALYRKADLVFQAYLRLVKKQKSKSRDLGELI